MEVHIIDESTVNKEKEKKPKGPIRGILGFDEEEEGEEGSDSDLNHQELMNRAFAGADAGAEEDFAEDKARVIADDEKEYKRKHKIQDAFSMEGWGDWAGMVLTYIYIELKIEITISE